MNTSCSLYAHVSCDRGLMVRIFESLRHKGDVRTRVLYGRLTATESFLEAELSGNSHAIEEGVQACRELGASVSLVASPQYRYDGGVVASPQMPAL
ncbi:MAG: hypothetical protein AAB074_13675 [Planctomycetota bacterium]